MARRYLPPQPPKFYVYYEKATGEIISATNEKSKTLKHGIEVPFEIYNNLVTGREKFIDYTVGYLKTDDGKTVLSLVPRAQEAYSFKNTMFEIIDSAPTSNTELIVEWNIDNKYWTFSLSDAAKQRIADSLADTRLPFFVILENDYDFLIRTIIINCKDLTSKSKVAVPFETNIEQRIDKITVATKLTFESCGLQIND